MARKLTSVERDDLISSVSFTYTCRYGTQQAMKIIYEIYKELRSQNNKLKEKRKWDTHKENGKSKKR